MIFDFNILQQGNGEHRWPSGHYDVGGWDQVREGGETHRGPGMPPKCSRSLYCDRASATAS